MEALKRSLTYLKQLYVYNRSLQVELMKMNKTEETYEALSQLEKENRRVLLKGLTCLQKIDKLEGVPIRNNPNAMRDFLRGLPNSRYVKLTFAPNLYYPHADEGG